MNFYNEDSARLHKKMAEASTYKYDSNMFPQISSMSANDINGMTIPSDQSQMLDSRIPHRHSKQISAEFNKYFCNELNLQAHGMAALSGRSGNLPEELQNKKPELSYNILITIAIDSSNKKKLTVSEIYAWFIKNFPYFTNCQSNWRNSIRHLLSINPNFVRLQRPKNESGKGCYWTLSSIAKEKGLALVDNKSEESSNNQSPISDMAPRMDHQNFANSPFKSYSSRVRSDSFVQPESDHGIQIRSRSRTMSDRNDLRMKTRVSRSVNSGFIPSREDFHCNFNRQNSFTAKPFSSNVGMMLYQNSPVFPSPYHYNTPSATPNHYSTSSSAQITPNGGISQSVNHLPYDFTSDLNRNNWTNPHLQPNPSDPIDFRTTQQPAQQQQFNHIQIPEYQYYNGNSTYFPKNLLETQEMKRLNMMYPNNRMFMSGPGIAPNNGIDGQNLNATISLEDSKNIQHFDRKFE